MMKRRLNRRLEAGLSTGRGISNDDMIDSV